jgi:hypothetical protein
MRALVLAVAMLTACSPAGPAPDGQPGAGIEAVDPEQAAVTGALSPVVAEEIGRPVSFSVDLMRVDGDWAWLVARPWTPEGTQIDWSQTRYADRAQLGALDGAGTTYALLRRQNGQWRVVEFAVGPTDVAWADWADRHGAPASLIQTN